MSSDTRWVIGIMIALFILNGMFMNARINDVQTGLTARINDLQMDIQTLQADVRGIRTLLVDHVTDYDIHQPPD